MNNRYSIGPLLACVLAVSLSGNASAPAAELRLTAVERLPDGRFRLSFEDTGLGVLNFVPEFRLSLDSGSTNTLTPGARITEVSPGRFQTTIPAPSPQSAFFRIAGFGGLDSDGDGLADDLERLIGTSTNSFDTDLDGFGDGYELVNGSDPTSAASIPDVTRASFAAAQSVAREGDGTVLVPVTFTKPFAGTLRYSVAAVSTAGAGTDFVPLSGLLPVNGANAAIPVTLFDDLEVEDVKLLVLDLEGDPDFAYQTGGATRHTMRIHDNDAHWSGVLRNDASEHAFRLRMLRQGSTVQAALVSTLDTNNPANNQGVGSIPPGVWPMVSATLTTNTFSAVSAPIPMGSSSLFGNVRLLRTLSFNVLPDVTGGNPGTNYLFRTNMLIGTFLDRLEAEQPQLGYFTRQTTGIVILVEDPPRLPFTDTPAVPAATAAAFSAPHQREAQR